MKLPIDIERLALLGWRLYPVSTRSRAACFPDATDAATHDLDRLEQWARDYPGCGWRVVMEGSGIWGLDLDAPSADHSADGVAAFAQIAANHPGIPPRPMSRSGGGGLALFFRHRGDPITGRTGYPAPGIDPRRGRLSVTVPPSRHHRTGFLYRWIVAPWEISPPDAPAWLLNAVAPPPEEERRPVPSYGTDTQALRILDDARRAISSAPTGAANVTLNRHAFLVARFVAAQLLGERQATDALMDAARSRKIPPYEAAATLRSAFRAGLRQPVRS